ncbi:contactin rig-6-like [Mercenaria mercenaria]|uniref:contactin rig-6-like n=1 Tax=Mercenaria mercenaria TaxID=6596 RepID=UPI00234EEB66|nr:contactin rig-6-like [Mercenaria mercenaria]
MNRLFIATCLVCITGIYARMSPPSISEPQGNKWNPDVEYIRIPDSKSKKCNATANPKAKYYWTFNGERISSDESTVAVDETTGLLTTGSSFSESNSGDYQCFAYNDVGTTMTPILKLVTAKAGPFAGSSAPEPAKIVTASQYVKLECKDMPESVPRGLVGWKRGITRTERDPNKFVPVELEADRMMIDEDGSLHFLWTKTSDSYYYGCEITNVVYIVSYGSKKVVELIVNNDIGYERGPELKSSSKDVVVYAGHDAELQCIFSYYSTKEKLTIRWLHKGNTVGANSPNITLHDVKIPTDKQDMSGKYRCETTIGGETASGEINVKIVSPPTFLPGQDLKTKYVSVEKDAVFHCGTTSYQTYSYPTVWLVNGEPILGCPERKFECNQPLANTEYSQCIPENNVCDGVADCTDGSDELNCPNPCLESQKVCRGACVPKTSSCDELICNYPDFLCHDKLKCVSADSRCNKIDECPDESDEWSCPDGADTTIGRFIINSQRSQLTLPNLSHADTMCFQCIARNEYGTTIGEGCLKAIDKILVLRGPNSTYDVEPGSRIEIIMEATTDVEYQEFMNYTWQWYQEKTDETTGEISIVPQTLPPPGKMFTRYFSLTKSNKHMVMTFPEVKKGDEDEENELEIYNTLINRVYTVIIQHKYDKVELNFTVSGKQIEPPPVPIVEAASTNLWFIALILGILLLFIVVALIVCYMYRNRGGTYPSGWETWNKSRF